jgi:uncharacterized membrane protein
MSVAPITDASIAIQIHLGSAILSVILFLVIGVMHRGNTHAYRSAMFGIAIGGLLVAGALSFMLGRALYHVFVAG